MASTLSEILLVFILILANGFFALSEIAVISARRARLQQLAEGGNHSAQEVLTLLKSSGRFLSTVQVGITLVGIFAGAFGGATLATRLAVLFEQLPLLAPYSEPISFGLVVVVITYLSLVIGELVPKQIALTHAEQIAMLVAQPMGHLSRLTGPIVSLLSLSTRTVLKLLRIEPTDTEPVTSDEIRIMIEQGTRAGAFQPLEGELVEGVFRLGDQRIGALITPRPEIVWLDLDDSPQEWQRQITDSGHTRFPVARAQVEEVVGVVLAKDLLAQSLSGQPLDLEAAMQAPLFVPETMPALTVLERFKETYSHIALVINEYGGLEGLVTVGDVLDAIAGDLPEGREEAEPEVVQREDGSWLLDGMLAIDTFKDLFKISEPIPGHGRYYWTLGGFVMSQLGQVPDAGDYFEWRDLRLEVVDMDGRRVDKVLVSEASEEDEG